MPDGKPNWTCSGKSCKGSDGKPFVNFGHRTTCKLCSVDKSKCFSKHVTPSTRPPASNFAERQVGDRKASEKMAEKMAKMETELKSLKASNAKLAKQKKEEPSAVEEVDDDEDTSYTLDHLFQQRTVFKSFGKSGEEDVARLSSLIAAKQEEKLAKQPCHVQIKQAEGKVRRAKAADVSSKAKTLLLQAEWVALQEKISEHAELELQGEKELADAEAAFDLVVKSLKEIPAAPPAVEPVSTTGYVAITATLPDAFYTEAGYTREQVNGLLAGLAAGHEKIAAAQRVKDEAAAAASRAAAASAAQLEKVADEEKALAAATPAASPAPPAPPPGTLNGALVLDDELMLEFQSGLSGAARKKFDVMVEDSKRRRLQV
jgi:hypothetical protein